MVKIRHLVHALLITALLAVGLFWAGPVAGQSPEPSGFRALKGEKARAFHPPANLHLMARMPVSHGNLTAERYKQFVGSAQVLGGQLTIYRQTDGQILAVIGGYYPNLIVTNQVRLNAEQAIAVAATQIGSEGEWFTDLMVDPETGRFFYRVENRRFDSRWFYWLDAESGAILNAYNGLAEGWGIGVLGDTKDLTGLTTLSSGVYQMVSADGRQSTCDARSKWVERKFPVTDDNDVWDTPGRTTPGQAAMVDAQFYAKVVDNYLLNTHSFDWLTYFPQGMHSCVHVGPNWWNAQWNGSSVGYGDGDGVNRLNYSGALDVVGHEFSHGVTDILNGLIYQDEPGALNEAFSDIMGEVIEFYYGGGDWTHAEDITVGTNGNRNLANPNEDGDPSHYADKYTGTEDWGGVHTNSGIANHWFYLLVNGGQNANPARASGTNVQGIGLAAAEQIVFLGFAALPATANFCSARESTIAIAGSYGANVADAWDEVGVDEVLCNPGGAGPVIRNVASNSKFVITWDTDVPANSEVTIKGLGTYTDPALVTSHSMSFKGKQDTIYEFYVSSTNANGNKTTEGPFYLQK